MLTIQQLRQVAQRSGARDIVNVEIDVILTHLLELFHERGIVDHVAFKGGTLLRKMHFGPRGRLSTDLDFTCRSTCSQDDLMLMILDALEAPYHGISFRIERDKDWYFTEDGLSANPVCTHRDNPHGIKIKLQVSTREKPILPVLPQLQLEQDYFRLLPFKPAAIPSLAFEEAVAEKIRAASQRSKIRDLHDLSEVAKRALDQDRIRALAVLKLWNSGGQGLDYEVFRQRIAGAGDYDVADLRNLLRRDENPDLQAMIGRVTQDFQFLRNLTELEATIAADGRKQAQDEATALLASLRGAV
jgi:predicted nucleotidyltransferase component of viral defense system